MSGTRSVYGWLLPKTDRQFPQYPASAPKVEGRRMYQPQHIQATLEI